MSTLQEMVYAEEWLDLALSTNELGDFILGIAPYAKTRLNPDGVPEPVLGPNLECLYRHHQENPSIGFDQTVASEVCKAIREKGSNDYVIFLALMFVTAQLERERTNRAGFTLDCAGILAEIRQQIHANEAKFHTKSLAFEGSVWPCIEFYDDHLSALYHQHVL